MGAEPDPRGLRFSLHSLQVLKDPVPIQPTDHYSMGGIPADNDCHVYLDEKGKHVVGFYVAGECSCISVHGANRLGANSLLEALVFGRRAGKKMRRRRGCSLRVDEWRDRGCREEIRRSTRSGTEDLDAIREELKQTMTLKAGVYRDAAGLEPAQAKIKQLRQRFSKVRVRDKGKAFNINLLETPALSNMLEFSELIVDGALARQESRGAHFRNDFPKRDDNNWLKHTLAFRTADGGHQLRYKPVTITKYQPEGRARWRTTRCCSGYRVRSGEGQPPAGLEIEVASGATILNAPPIARSRIRRWPCATPAARHLWLLAR
jgi:succinate dehydrogenase / fumarate reductase flavoprotein subunit